MYAFLDRPVQSLNRGGQLLIWAMRHWVRAASAGRCPCGDIGPAHGGWQAQRGCRIGDERRVLRTVGPQRVIQVGDG